MPVPFKANTVIISGQGAITLTGAQTSNPTTSKRIVFDDASNAVIACVDLGGDPELYYVVDGASHIFNTRGGTLPDTFSIGGSVATVNNRLVVEGYTEMQGGRKFGRTSVDHTSVHSVDYTTDGILGCDTTSGAVTINLFDPVPVASRTNGYTVTIKDEGGNASTNPITINRGGSSTIDGDTSLVLNIDYSSVTLYCNSTNWFIT